jgi:hypothetical protein
MLLESILKRFVLLLKVAFRKVSLVVINGPGIENTASLVNYLEASNTNFSTKLITKLYVS